jgi:hypothetical protein
MHKAALSYVFGGAYMQIYRVTLKTLLVLAVILIETLCGQAQDKASSGTVPVRMTVTLNVLGDKRMPEVNRDDVFVKQGKDRLRVTDWTPATGDHAGLDLFILIDDACDNLGPQLDDLRSFINAQPPTTSVGVGYMRNATVQIVQDFTRDHDQAAKALRLPIASAGAYGSPYLSLIDLMKRWPEHQNRREVVMVTDGIDRARRGGPPSRGLGPLSPDVDSASRVAQRTGTIIHTIYAPGVGRLHRNFWEANNGQNGIAKLSDETGGESFFLGLQSPVSLNPYLAQVQKILENQYLLGFLAKPGKKAGSQYVTLGTEVAGVELVSAESVWVPAAK